MNKKILPIVGAAVFTVTLGSLAGTFLSGSAANAANDTATTVSDSSNGTTSNTDAPPAGNQQPAHDPSQGGHVANGVTETVLTGSDAEKAKAAALAAVPGGTVERVENEADGNGTYEAHMTKSDGSRITVYMDANFNVTSTADGPGAPNHK